MTARPTNCSGRNREECPRRSKSGVSGGVPEKTIKLDGLAFQWTGLLLSVCPNILRRPEIEPKWHRPKASLGNRSKQDGTVPSTGPDTASGKGRTKPPQATPKPYTRHILGINSGVQSYPKATLKPHQSHLKATLKPPSSHPQATLKPPSSHILGIDSGVQSYPKATLKPLQSHLKATSKAPSCGLDGGWLTRQKWCSSTRI